MKTTLTIDDTVMARVRREATERRCTMSALVESAVRWYLDGPPLPTFSSGGFLVDIDDREALYKAMERGWSRSLTRASWSMR